MRVLRDWFIAGTVTAILAGATSSFGSDGMSCSNAEAVATVPSGFSEIMSKISEEQSRKCLTQTIAFSGEAVVNPATDGLTSGLTHLKLIKKKKKLTREHQFGRTGPNGTILFFDMSHIKSSKNGEKRAEISGELILSDPDFEALKSLAGGCFDAQSILLDNLASMPAKGAPDVAGKQPYQFLLYGGQVVLGGVQIPY